MLAADCVFRPLPDTALRLEGGGRVWFGGYCRFAADWTNHPHRHPAHHELCLVLNGSGEFVHGKRIHELAPGSLFVSDLDIVHEIRSPQTRDLDLVFISWLPGIDARAEPAPLRAFRAGHRIHLSGQEQLAHLLPLLHEEIDAAWHRREVLRSLLLLGFGALATRPVDDEERLPGPLHQATRYMRAHLSEALSVGDIAMAVELGERQLRRLFRQHLDCTVVQALQEERLRQASRLLVMRLPVAETARRVGIASPSMFCRLFKQHYGCTPRAWQAREAPRETLATTAFGRG